MLETDVMPSMPERLVNRRDRLQVVPISPQQQLAEDLLGMTVLDNDIDAVAVLVAITDIIRDAVAVDDIDDVENIVRD